MRRKAIPRVRVKGWGKSPPRARQRARRGKPRREQDRIGMVRRGRPRRGGFRPSVRVGRLSQTAMSAPEEWPPRSRLRARAIQNPAYRPAGEFLRRERSVQRLPEFFDRFATDRKPDMAVCHIVTSANAALGGGMHPAKRCRRLDHLAAVYKAFGGVAVPQGKADRETEAAHLR